MLRLQGRLRALAQGSLMTPLWSDWLSCGRSFMPSVSTPRSRQPALLGLKVVAQLVGLYRVLCRRLWALPRVWNPLVDMCRGGGLR